MNGTAHGDLTSARPTPAPHLASERVVVEAPLSFTGSARRIWHGVAWDRRPPAVWVTLAVVLVALAWFVVLGWYLAWGPFLVPYRLVRRSTRRRRADEARHRETVAVLLATRDARGLRDAEGGSDE